MLLNEKDARTRCCPLLESENGELRNCLGAQCMMWRFKHPERMTENDAGYCGIAGKPAGAM